MYQQKKKTKRKVKTWITEDNINIFTITYWINILLTVFGLTWSGYYEYCLVIPVLFGIDPIKMHNLCKREWFVWQSIYYICRVNVSISSEINICCLAVQRNHEKKIYDICHQKYNIFYKFDYIYGNQVWLSVTATCNNNFMYAMKMRRNTHFFKGTWLLEAEPICFLVALRSVVRQATMLYAAIEWFLQLILVIISHPHIYRLFIVCMCVTHQQSYTIYQGLIKSFFNKYKEVHNTAFSWTANKNKYILGHGC